MRDCGCHTSPHLDSNSSRHVHSEHSTSHTHTHTQYRIRGTSLLWSYYCALGRCRVDRTQHCDHFHTVSECTMPTEDTDVVAPSLPPLMDPSVRLFLLPLHLISAQVHTFGGDGGEDQQVFLIVKGYPRAGQLKIASSGQCPCGSLSSQPNRVHARRVQSNGHLSRHDLQRMSSFSSCLI